MLSFRRLIKSFKYAGRGLGRVIYEEQNFQIELIVAALVLIAAWWLNIGAFGLAMLVAMIALVLVMEIINSALEAVSDALKPRLNNYVKKIKDIVAAGVMVAALAAVVVGILIFWHYIM